MLLKEIMLEGMLSIQAGENPRIIERSLRHSYLLKIGLWKRKIQWKGMNSNGKEKIPKQKQGGNEWLTTYGDMVTLLLTFSFCYSPFRP